MPWSAVHAWIIECFQASTMMQLTGAACCTYQCADVDHPVEPVEEGALVPCLVRIALVKLISAKRGHAGLDASSACIHALCLRTTTRMHTCTELAICHRTLGFQVINFNDLAVALLYVINKFKVVPLTQHCAWPLMLCLNALTKTCAWPMMEWQCK